MRICAVISLAGGIAGLAFFACNSTPPPPTTPNDVTQVTVLQRPSDSDASVVDNSPPPSPTDVGPGAGNSTPTPAPVDPGLADLTPAQLGSQAPGTYTVTGYVVRTSICPRCNPGKACKPCVPNAVYISALASDAANAIDLQIADPSAYQAGSHYRFVVTVATSSAGSSPTRHLLNASPL